MMAGADCPRAPVDICTKMMSRWTRKARLVLAFPRGTAGDGDDRQR